MRDLLTAIIAYASLAKEDAASSQEISESLAAIHDAGLRASALMRTLDPATPAPPLAQASDAREGAPEQAVAIGRMRDRDP